MRAAAAAILFGAAMFAAASPKPPKPTKTPASKAALDFSGTWELDEKVSVNVSPQMKGAVLSVEQEGNQILISPVQGEGKPRQDILAEALVVDGRPYEKSLGPAGKGLVTAGWSPDGKSLWIEVEAGPPGNRRAAVQRSVWKISEDRTVWVRESTSTSGGRSAHARLVFRKAKEKKGTAAK